MLFIRFLCVTLCNDYLAEQLRCRFVSLQVLPDNPLVLLSSLSSIC